MQLHDIPDDWEDSLEPHRISPFERELPTSRSRAQLLETKLATALEANCVLCSQLDKATYQLVVERADAQRKIRALVESHESDLATIHSTYAMQLAAHEECSTATFRLQGEIELTNLGHAEEVTALQHTIQTLCTQLVPATSVCKSARQQLRELQEQMRAAVADAVSDRPPFEPLALTEPETPCLVLYLFFYSAIFFGKPISRECIV